MFIFIDFFNLIYILTKLNLSCYTMIILNSSGEYFELNTPFQYSFDNQKININQLDSSNTKEITISELKTMKRWDGFNWVNIKIKMWNGNSWVDI